MYLMIIVLKMKHEVNHIDLIIPHIVQQKYVAIASYIAKYLTENKKKI